MKQSLLLVIICALSGSLRAKDLILVLNPQKDFALGRPMNPLPSQGADAVRDAQEAAKAKIVELLKAVTTQMVVVTKFMHDLTNVGFTSTHIRSLNGTLQKQPNNKKCKERIAYLEKENTEHVVPETREVVMRYDQIGATGSETYNNKGAIFSTTYDEHLPNRKYLPMTLTPKYCVNYENATDEQKALLDVEEPVNSALPIDLFFQIQGDKKIFNDLSPLMNMLKPSEWWVTNITNGTITRVFITGYSFTNNLRETLESFEKLYPQVKVVLVTDALVDMWKHSDYLASVLTVEKKKADEAVSMLQENEEVAERGNLLALTNQSTPQIDFEQSSDLDRTRGNELALINQPTPQIDFEQSGDLDQTRGNELALTNQSTPMFNFDQLGDLGQTRGNEIVHVDEDNLFGRFDETDPTITSNSQLQNQGNGSLTINQSGQNIVLLI